MSDYEDFESLDDLVDDEEEEVTNHDNDWEDSADDMEPDEWARRYGSGEEEVPDLDEDYDDDDLDNLENDFFED